MPSIHSFHSKSWNETKSFAARMAKKITPGSVIALTGNLGTGKTTFTQGFARGLGIADRVGSPSFKLVSEYNGKETKLFHVDCYRLTNERDFLNIGGEELLTPSDGITLIEWADVIQDILPEKTIIITFERIPDKPEERLILVTI